MRKQSKKLSPSFPLKRVYQDRDRLYADLSGFVGVTPEHKSFESICDCVGQTFNVTQPKAVFETVRSLPPQPLTHKLLWNFSWLLAANSTKLRHGEPVRPWTSQVRDEWVPFEIMDIHYISNERLGQCYDVEFRAIAGSCCTMTIHKLWSFHHTRMHAEKFGFTYRGRKKLVMRDHRQFIRLRMAAHILAEQSLEKPRFRNYEVAGGLLQFNKQILKQRIRRDPPCPNNFSHPCHVCPIGWARGSSTCPASIHPITWDYRMCSSCDTEQWFDPANPSDTCIKCQRRTNATESTQ